MEPAFGVYPAASASPTAAFDAFELVCPAAGLVSVGDFRIWQTTELGDAAEEQLTLEWIVGFTVSGSGGQTTNIAAYNGQFDAADTFTAEALNTTGANTGTTRTPWADGWNVRMPYREIAVPEGLLVLRNGERGVMRVSAPADAITARCFMRVHQG